MRRPPRDRILFYGESGELFRKRVGFRAVGVDLHRDGAGKVQTEDPHDGLRVDDVAAGDEVDLKELGARKVDEFLHVVDADELDLQFLHDSSLLSGQTENGIL